MFSTYSYYYSNFLRRVFLQKHISCPRILNITLQISQSQLLTVEDSEITNSLVALELLSGQKAYLAKSGSRFVGTSKKSFFLADVSLRKTRFFAVLEVLALFLLPNLQRRLGLFTTSWFQGDTLAICCKDLQLFENYFAVCLKSNLVINLGIVASDNFARLDLLQFLKFNIQQ